MRPTWLRSPTVLVSLLFLIPASFAHAQGTGCGTVAAWGDNTYGQVTVPAGLSGIAAISAGGYHTVALKSDGTVVAWGRNDEGQTGVPVGLTDIAAISAGGYHTVALRSDSTVLAWGANYS